MLWQDNRQSGYDLALLTPHYLHTHTQRQAGLNTHTQRAGLKEHTDVDVLVDVLQENAESFVMMQLLVNPASCCK